jgi:hypothetical protein
MLDLEANEPERDSGGSSAEPPCFFLFVRGNKNLPTGFRMPSPG